ncbi:MAG: hypothetical protein H6Q73_926 [Firmicutes bacterium]|nr:hypothetical protein [Bacillota bacterium]
MHIKSDTQTATFTRTSIAYKTDGTAVASGVARFEDDGLTIDADSETLTLPSGTLLNTKGTIVFDFTPGDTGTLRYLVDGGGATNANLLLYLDPNDYPVLVYGTGSAEVTLTANKTVTAKSRFTLRYSSSGVSLLVNGVTVMQDWISGTSITITSTAPSLTLGTTYICSKQDGTLQACGQISNLNISNIYRSDDWAAVNGMIEKTIETDKNTIYYADLMADLLDIEYALPKYAVMTAADLSQRVDATSKMFQHGGILTADGKVDYREIEITVEIDQTTTANYFAVVDLLKRYLAQADYKLYITGDRYINISNLSSISETFVDGWYLKKSELTITLLALDPFWYTGTATSTTTITATGQSFTVTNSGSIDTPIEITITATDACTSITLVNSSDNSRTLSYINADFTAGKVLVINSTDGTVELNGDNTINYLTGTFMHLVPGDNIFTYTGGACTIKIDYPVRWL